MAEEFAEASNRHSSQLLQLDYPEAAMFPGLLPTSRLHPT